MNAANYNWTEPINRASDKPGEIQGVLANSGEVSLEKYPKVMVWIERVESRESYEASV